jgi:lincosamide nucleotidyltransferase A/C/D/E
VSRVTPEETFHERARAQLAGIHAVLDVLGQAGVSAWLFGGWGLDARIGRITRHHGDIEFWVERPDGERATAALVEAGAILVDSQPPEESREFTWNGASFSTAFFDTCPDGTYRPQGRWSDWVFPAGSFSDSHGVLDGRPVPVMSVAWMLAMKQQFPTLRNGAPLRPKDVRDIDTLRELLAHTDSWPCR